MSVDVVIVGGSFAGLQAAMVLARHRFTILVVDSGVPRNRFADAVHNVLALDGETTREVLKKMREQTLSYPTVSLKNAKATRIQNVTEGDKEPAFLVDVQESDGKEQTQLVSCRRVILAHGVNDSLPAIRGLWDYWGGGVAHCPHCRGWEVRDKKLAVLLKSTGPQLALSLEMARELTSQPVTLFTNGAILAEQERKTFKHVTVVENPISELEGDPTRRILRRVVLTNGSSVEVDCLFVASGTTPAGDFHTQLGLKTENGHTGPYISCDAQRMTNVKGVYVVGDAGNVYHQVSLASASGSLAGIFCHISLLMANVARAAVARL